MSVSTKSGRDKAKQAWQSPERAAAYRVSREPSQFTRYAREEQFVSDWLDDLPAQSLVLDVPCGTGRFIPLLTDCGLHYVGADFSLAMIHEAQRFASDRATLGFVGADAEHLPFQDECVDCIIIWRLLHHIGDVAIRQAILREAARVSRSKVLVSFHHSISFTHWRKVFQSAVLGQMRGRHGVSHWQLKREAAACGLRMEDVRSFHKYISVNWFACFQKISASGTPGGHVRCERL